MWFVLFVLFVNNALVRSFGNAPLFLEPTGIGKTIFVPIFVVVTLAAPGTIARGQIRVGRCGVANGGDFGASKAIPTQRSETNNATHKKWNHPQEHQRTGLLFWKDFVELVNFCCNFFHPQKID